MPFKDKDDSFSIFPTRHGDPMGTAWESRMIQSVGGYKDIRSKVIEVGEGTTVMLKTRAGMPDFTTLKEKESSEDQYEYRYDYGFVDTKFSTTGVNSDSSGGILKNLVDETGAIKLNTLIKNDAGWKSELHDDLPTNYSGMMRRVAQVRHGAQERVLTGGTPGVPRKTGVEKFYFTYATSDGLWVDPSTGERWIIEINGTGVYRIPIKFMQELPSDWIAHEASVFASNNYPAAVNILTPYWEVIEFKRENAIKIGDAPDCYASGCATWYSWLGWAFNYTGTAATLVCIRNDPADDSWLQTIMYDMAITTTSEGVPSYVSVGAGGAKRIATNVNDGVPDGTGVFQVAASYPGVCSTVSLYRPDCPALKAAIFSYYTPTGSKRVFEYEVYAKNTDPQSENNATTSLLPVHKQGWFGYGAAPYPPDWTTNIAIAGPSSGVVSRNETGTFGGGYGFLGNGSATGSGDKATSRTETIRKSSSNNGWVLNWGGWPYSMGTPTTNPFSDPDGDGHYNVVNTDATIPTWHYATALVDVAHSSKTQTIITNCAVVMAGYDREAIAFATFTNNYTTPYTETESVAPATLINGPSVASGNPTFSPYLDFMSMGTFVVEFDNGPPAPDRWYVTGYIDFSALYGQCVSGGSPNLQSGLYTGSETLVPTPTETRSIPATTTTSGSWRVSVGATDFSAPLLSGEVFQTYLSGEAFAYHIGASAWSGGIGGSTAPRRYFYSPDITVPVTTVGIGGYNPCVHTLHNFIGVF